MDPPCPLRLIEEGSKRGFRNTSAPSCCALSNHVRFSSATPTSNNPYGGILSAAILYVSLRRQPTLPPPFPLLPRQLILHFPATLGFPQVFPHLPILTAASYTATTDPLYLGAIYFALFNHVMFSLGTPTFTNPTAAAYTAIIVPLPPRHLVFDFTTTSGFP